MDMDPITSDGDNKFFPDLTAIWHGTWQDQIML